MTAFPSLQSLVQRGNIRPECRLPSSARRRGSEALVLETGRYRLPVTTVSECETIVKSEMTNLRFLEFHIYAGEHGEGEGGGLSGTRLRLSNHITRSANQISNQSSSGRVEDNHGFWRRRGSARSWIFDGFWNPILYTPLRRFGILE